jgi:oligoribonuclease
MSKRRFCWIDLEMTGLDPEVDRILEAGVIVTDKFLEPVYEWETAVCQPSEVLESMNDWCKHHHRESGLLKRVPTGISEKDLDRKLEKIVIKHFKKKNPVVICGNSIAQDRKFIDKYLPHFAERLHYRMLDVSSFKIVFREMLGREFKKANSHRALDDIRESIAELKYYMGAIDPTNLALIDNSHSPPADSEAG